jgi:alpha-glucosidase
MSVHTLHSPDGRVRLDLILDGGALLYSTWKDGIATCAPSPLGIVTDACALADGLALAAETRGAIDETYALPAFKKAVCRDRANTLRLELLKGGHRLWAEARAYDDGAAVRLVVPGEEAGRRGPSGRCGG